MRREGAVELVVVGIPSNTSFDGRGLTATSDNRSRRKPVDRFTYRLVLWTSASYLVGCLLPVLTPNKNPTAALEDAAWIPALQGVVAAFLGRLFLSSEAETKDGETTHAPRKEGRR
jgi:hypothetical protein